MDGRKTEKKYLVKKLLLVLVDVFMKIRKIALDASYYYANYIETHLFSRYKTRDSRLVFPYRKNSSRIPQVIRNNNFLILLSLYYATIEVSTTQKSNFDGCFYPFQFYMENFLVTNQSFY